MKRIDSLLVRTFMPPFFLAFGVVMFVFTMQTMWKFIDDIIGKGASIGMIIEFVFYLSLGLMPTALPAAILLSSLYIMGNLSEKYELTAMKSAGISLWRIMRPLIAVCIGISIFSFVCSNYIAPTANLKFKTRLFNFKSQKLALSLNEGIFNDDFRNYSIRIGEKDEETEEIKDIMLYDHSIENRNRTKIITANEGKIDMESDERFMIMELRDGRQYQEMEEEKGRKPSEPRKYPYLRIKFENLEKYLDLSEFEMKDMREELFKDQEQMLSLRQLIYEMDTMLIKISDKRDYLSNSVSAYYHFVKMSDSTSFFVPMVDVKKKDVENRTKNKTKNKINKAKILPSKLEKPTDAGLAKNRFNNTTTKPKAPLPPKPTSQKYSGKLKEEKLIKTKLLGTPESFEEIFLPKHRNDVKSRATNAAKAIKEKAASHIAKIGNLKNKRDRYTYQIHLKFSLAVACMIFLFIGAPLGAIIRKGGFGYPILFGVLLFVIFVALLTVFKKLGDNGNLPHPSLAAWIPVFIFFIPCFFLTKGAVQDVKAMNMEAMESWFKNLWIVKKILS